jgi:hypothetical protein
MHSRATIAPSLACQEACASQQAFFFPRSRAERLSFFARRQTISEIRHASMAGQYQTRLLAEDAGAPPTPFLPPLRIPALRTRAREDLRLIPLAPLLRATSPPSPDVEPGLDPPSLSSGEGDQGARGREINPFGPRESE